MIEIRPLNKIELDCLMSQALNDETRNLKSFLQKTNINAYDFLNNPNIVYKYGLVINKRPIYLAYVSFNEIYEIWSIVNSEVKEQKSLYKYTKLALQEALKRFSPIYATMECKLLKNIFWCKKMGFKIFYEDDKIVKLKIGA